MKDTIRKITGFSTPFGGISWTPPINEKEIAKNIIIYFDDRRLFDDAIKLHWPSYAVGSLSHIREILTNMMLELDTNSELFKILTSIRSICRNEQTQIENLPYLECTDPYHADFANGTTNQDIENFTILLTAIRQKIYVEIKKILEKYDIEPQEVLKKEFQN